MRSILTLIVILITSFAGIAQVEKTVIVEHFTNSRCGTCASRNPAFYTLLENYPQVLHIAYHPSAPYANCIFSMHNPTENDARTNFYGIYGATPRVVVQGEVIGFQSPMLNAGQIEDALGKTSDFMIYATQSQTDNDEVNVQIVVKKVSETSSQSQLLFAIIAEKEVNYAAPNGENLHHDVFRKLLLDEDFSITNVGDSLIYNETYTIHEDWEAEELFITLIVQDETTSGILQSSASETLNAGPAGINDNEILSLDGLLYPNPARDVINISAENKDQFARAEFYAITGNLVKSFDDTESMNISDLPKGIYMAVLFDKQDRRHVSRVIKR